MKIPSKQEATPTEKFPSHILWYNTEHIMFLDVEKRRRKKL